MAGTRSELHRAPVPASWYQPGCAGALVPVPLVPHTGVMACSALAPSPLCQVWYKDGSKWCFLAQFGSVLVPDGCLASAVTSAQRPQERQMWVP